MKKKYNTMLICGYISTFLICANQEQTAIKANGEGVIIDTGNQDIDRFVYELTEWVDENKNKVVQTMQDLEDSAIMQQIDLVANTSLFAYYLTDYYNSHAVGAGLIEPTGSAMSGIYKIANDDRLYSASVYTIDSSSGGLLASSAHYSMAIRFEVVEYDPTTDYSIEDLIKNMQPVSDLFNVGTQFNIAGINNTFLRINYNGSGLFNSSTYTSGAATGYRITAYLNPNRNGIPTITNGYSWGNNAIMCTAYGRGVLTIPEATASDSTPWDYYNNNLLPQILEQYPDLIPDDFPFHGQPYSPASIDPTEPDQAEPATIPKTTLPIQEYVQPETEIIEITDESGEIIETEIAQVTETDGTPKYEVQFPSIPMLPIPDVQFPSADIPVGLIDGITGIWAAIQRILDSTGLMGILPFVLIAGLIVFVIKFLG